MRFSVSTNGPAPKFYHYETFEQAASHWSRIILGVNARLWYINQCGDKILLEEKR
jgi:hypothetical protein